MMNDADTLEGIEAICEAALGKDEHSVAIGEILRLCRKRKSERHMARQPLLDIIRQRPVDPLPGEDH